MNKPKRERKITFTSVGVEQGSRVWRNSETGVEVIKGNNFATVGLYYVCLPSQKLGGGRYSVHYCTSFAEARREAAKHALVMRDRIARAYIEAHGEENRRWNEERAKVRESKNGAKRADALKRGDVIFVADDGCIQLEVFDAYEERGYIQVDFMNGSRMTVGKSSLFFLAEERG